MAFKNLKLEGLILITPEKYVDDRGFFQESYNKKEFDQIVGRNVNFVQDNFSESHKGVFRGIHFQKKPFEQGKLVRVTFGSALDFAVDLRIDSPTYLEWIKVKLSAKNSNQLWIPEGFGHAFLALSETVHFSYKTTNYYDKESEECIAWDDPKINLKEALEGFDLKISDKDKEGSLI